MNRPWRWMADEDRLWSRIKVGDQSECWPWTGTTNSHGYGILTWRGKRTGSHRAAWESLHKATMLRPFEACHTCDNPVCSNPHHIWPGTHVENLEDAGKKNRMGPKVPFTGGLSKQDFCNSGHAMTPENTYRPPYRANSHSFVICRTCKRTGLRQWRKERAQNSV